MGRLELKFIPVVERVIERLHSLVKGVLPGKKKKRSPVTVSLGAGRLKELEARIDRYPTVFNAVADNFEKVRNSWQQIQAFHFSQHPLVVEKLKQQRDRPHVTSFDTVVMECLYHTSGANQFRDAMFVQKPQRQTRWHA